VGSSYSLGPNSSAVNLKLWDLDPERGTVTIRQGKGKKGRIIPIGDRAAATRVSASTVYVTLQ